MSFSFSSFVRFLDIFKFLQCVFLIFSSSSVSCCFLCSAVCVSYFMLFSVFLVIFWVLTCEFLFFVLFCQFFFFAIFQVLQCLCLIFHVFQFSHHSAGQCLCLFFHVFQVSRHIPYPRVCVSHFPSFSVFSPYFRSYTLWVSISTYFSFFAIFQFLECVFLISTFFGFLAVIQVAQCVFLILHVFQCFSPYSRS